MYWQESENEKTFQVPDDIIDLVFKVKGKSIEVDHAWNLAKALEKVLGEQVFNQIGVHPILTGHSANGWNRPEDEVYLSRRANLVIRLQRELLKDLEQLTGQSFDLGGHQIELGETHERALSTHDTVFARGVACDPEQDETDFMAGIAQRLEQMGVPVRKMLCGKDAAIKVGDDSITVRDA